VHYSRDRTVVLDKATSHDRQLLPPWPLGRTGRSPRTHPTAHIGRTASGRPISAVGAAPPGDYARRPWFRRQRILAEI